MAEEMTIEQLQEALANAQSENERLKGEAGKLKKAVDNACGDASKFKKELAGVREELNSKMSDTERLERERKEQDDALRAEIEVLKKEKLVSGYKATYLSMGYSEELAEQSAKALAEGDINAVFSAQKQYNEVSRQEFEKKKVDGMSNPPAGSPIDNEKVEIDKMRKWMGL